MSASPVRQWKRHTAPTEISVPSGNVALVRRPDSIRVFMSDGFIPNSLLPIVEKALKNDGEEMKTGEVLAEASSNKNLLNDMMAMQDNIVVKCVVAPEVRHVPVYEQAHVDAGLVTEYMLGKPIPFGSKDREFGFWDGEGDNPDNLPALPLFVDEVDTLDKQYIWQFCMGGHNDLERFRDESAANMAAVADVAGPGSETV